MAALQDVVLDHEALEVTCRHVDAGLPWFHVAVTATPPKWQEINGVEFQQNSIPTAECVSHLKDVYLACKPRT